MRNCNLFLEFLGKAHSENCCCLSVCSYEAMLTCCRISLPCGATCCLWNQFLQSFLSPPDHYGPNALLLVCHLGSIGVKCPGVVIVAGGRLRLFRQACAELAQPVLHHVSSSGMFVPSVCRQGVKRQVTNLLLLISDY